MTYCDRTDCTQAYTSGESSAPLDINLAGMFGREMVVKVGGVLYFQKDGKAFEPSASAQSVPYIEHPWDAPPGNSGGNAIPIATCLSARVVMDRNPEQFVISRNLPGVPSYNMTESPGGSAPRSVPAASARSRNHRKSAGSSIESSTEVSYFVLHQFHFSWHGFFLSRAADQMIAFRGMFKKTLLSTSASYT